MYDSVYVRYLKYMSLYSVYLYYLIFLGGISNYYPINPHWQHSAAIFEILVYENECISFKYSGKNKFYNGMRQQLILYLKKGRFNKLPKTIPKGKVKGRNVLHLFGEDSKKRKQKTLRYSVYILQDICMC